MTTKSEAKKFLKLLQEAKKSVPSNARLNLGPGTVERPRVHAVIDNIARCVVPRFVPVLKSVAPGKLDRKGSVIGGCGFVSESYPTPESRIDTRSLLDKLDGKKPRSIKRRPMAPLVQLDLEQIKASTGEDVGKGLLQVWLPWDCWGQGQATYCRTIPRGMVSKTKPLKACRLPRTPMCVDQGYDPAELEVLDEIDPDAAETLRYNIRYWGAVSGFSWELNEEEYGEFPKQIVGWKQNGYVLPQWDSVNVWSLDLDGWGQGAQYLRKASELAEAQSLQRVSIGLFEDDSNEAQFWPLEDRDTPAVVNGWRPLFSFHGPAVFCSVSDSHFIMFRRRAGRFEYASACTRWAW
jgi:hypothetical protein